MPTPSTRVALIMAGGAVVAALLVPFSAEAAKVAKVKITDGPHVAKVSAAGGLQVDDGSGPMTVDGSVAVTGTVGVTGSVTASIPGPVTIKPALPGTPYRRVDGYQGSGPKAVLFETSTGQTVSITSITVALSIIGATGSSPLIERQEIGVLHGPETMNCESPQTPPNEVVLTLNATTADTVHLSFPTPLVVAPEGPKTCVYLVPDLPIGGSNIVVTTVGYVQ